MLFLDSETNSFCGNVENSVGSQEVEKRENLTNNCFLRKHVDIRRRILLQMLIALEAHSKKTIGVLVPTPS